MVKDALERAIDITEPDRKFDNARLALEIRQRISEENDAINSYLSLVPHVTDRKIIEVIKDIADEEKVHVGELQEILYMLDPSEKIKEKEGREENG